MKIFVLSKTIDSNLVQPKVSRDGSNLRKELQAEYYKVTKENNVIEEHDTLMEDGILTLVTQDCTYSWKFDEIIC